MAEGSNDIFGEIARIEAVADEVLQKARAEAERLLRESERDAAELGERAASQIEQMKAKLGEEYQARTAGALAGIKAEFVAEQDALEVVRKKRFDEIVEWAASRIVGRDAKQRTNGD